MSDYPYSAEQQSSNAPEFTVSELSISLKRFVEENFGYVRVRGEISGFKRAASGHVYLALKDEKSVLDGVMWKGTAGRLNFRPEDGLEVICTGKLTTYPGRSKYQIVIDRMEPAGAGALMALLEERKKKLAAEGLFDPARKKPLPYLPEVIGVVTSPTGAVIRDILHRLHDRFPRRVLVWPVLVQGEGAADQVAEAIRGFNEMPEGGALPRPDVLIVARGGGSLEDLWSFNEEQVVRAAAESRIPLISAVGHETDTTLIDYASDRRAPTPTAAAEMAVPVRADLVYTVEDLAAQQNRAVQRLVTERRQRLEGLGRGLPKPQDLLSLSQQKFDDISERLPRALKHLSERQQLRLATVSQRLRSDILVRDIKRQNERVGDLGLRLNRAAARQLEQHRRALESSTRLFDSLNYKRVLDRGYAVIRDADGTAVTAAEAVKPGDGLDIEFRDGHVAARAEGGGTPPKPQKPKKAIKSADDDRQETLF
ncbi:exodeoxyribonuclease VII large subunit [Emcibacter nanhaiensis]|uniref:Exodeoxyribonuclease 7 large subunit n=1 Tax=Emcibacter nanhaiensis TaxID=1505037 RepID=A0A501PNR0_9PROT|nr:exodeoxyribonuclease VII large subunit [Emcibacter nanhaiensis]TPD62063.1 exodeoxyribonuclease VII large subunit [Emcibacter nanhaiensis]